MFIYTWKDIVDWVILGIVLIPLFIVSVVLLLCVIWEKTKRMIHGRSREGNP